MRIIVTLVLLVVSGGQSCLSGRSMSRRVHDLVRGYREARGFNGAVLVAGKNGIIFQGGMGHANHEWSAPVTVATRFWIASVTKQFTAAATLQLAAEGRLRLDATISNYLPEYPNVAARRITVEQLLTHTSGIPDYANREFMRTLAQCRHTPSQLLNLFWNRDVEFEPGSRFRYTNSGYV